MQAIYFLYYRELEDSQICLDTRLQVKVHGHTSFALEQEKYTWDALTCNSDQPACIWTAQLTFIQLSSHTISRDSALLLTLGTPHTFYTETPSFVTGNTQCLFNMHNNWVYSSMYRKYCQFWVIMLQIVQATLTTYMYTIARHAQLN